MVSIEKERSLQPFNTLGVDAVAAVYARVEEAADLPAVLEPFRDQPVLVLGAGSNILFVRERVEGLVLQPAILQRSIIDQDDDHVIVRAGAGEDWDDFVDWAVGQGFGGLENLSYIPGTAGAAPVQNIGAYGVEVRDILHRVHAISVRSGEHRVFDNAACRFGYRDSIFKQRLGEWLITAVDFRLTRRHHRLQMDYAGIRDVLGDVHTAEAEAEIQDIRDAVIQIRLRKLPLPKKIPNAGSFFRNPAIPQAQFDALKWLHADMPGYPMGDDTVKVPAGWLIEQCGWKGRALGRAAVHQHHALILVNLGQASGQDILSLAAAIQDAVRETFDIGLEPEVRIID